MDRETRGKSVYEVDWSGQGYEQLAQQLRDFLALKRQVDAEIKRGFARGPAPTGIVGAGGQPLTSAGAQAGFAQQQQYDASQRAVADANQRYARAVQQEAALHERAGRDATRSQQRAASEDFTARLRAQQEATRQATQQAAQTPAVFAGLTDTSGLKTDEDWSHYHQAIQTRYETALKNNEELSGADRKILSNTNAVAGIIGQRKNVEEQAARKGGLNSLLNAVGWMPFMPQELYLGQMALGEMGLGLGPLGVAAGLGLGAVGALGLGVVNTTASELQMQRMLAGISAGGSGTAVTPADQALADTLTQQGAQFGRTRQQMFSLLPTAAQDNLGNPQAIGGVVTGGLTLAAQGQLTDEQGVSLMGLLASRNGGDVQAAQREIVGLDGAIQQMGADTHTVYGAILQDGAALKAGTDLAGFATVAAALQGSGLTPMDLVGGAVQSTGVQRLVQAGVLGMSESQYIALQKDPAGMARALQGYAKQLMGETNSPSAAEAILGAEGFISGSQNPDQVLQEMLTGNFKNPPKLAGPPAPPALQNAAFDQATVTAMTVNTLTLPVLSRVGLAGQTAMTGVTDLVNGHPDTQAAQALGAMAATRLSQAGIAAANLAPILASGPGGVIEHLVQIVVTDVAGHVLGGATLQTKGASSQTQTTTPGQGPPANVQTRPAATPNSTNANGR